jgi:hypothetical protein
MLCERLHKERFNGVGSISEFISRVLMYREQLAHTTQALSDNEVVSHLITNLPSTWRIIRTIISNQPAASKTLNYTINALVNYETELRDEKIEDFRPDTNALMATASHRRGNTSRGRDRIEKLNGNSEREQPRCWYCLRPGHKKAVCRIRIQAEEEEKKRASAKSAYIAETSFAKAGFTETQML